MADADGNEAVLGEISKLKLRNEPYKITRQLTPTTYQLEHPETGKLKPRPVHVAQIARLRVPVQERTVEDGGTTREYTAKQGLGGVWMIMRLYYRFQGVIL